jgi:hypothetical protein
VNAPPLLDSFSRIVFYTSRVSICLHRLAEISVLASNKIILNYRDDYMTKFKPVLSPFSLKA